MPPAPALLFLSGHHDNDCYLGLQVNGGKLHRDLINHIFKLTFDSFKKNISAISNI